MQARCPHCSKVFETQSPGVQTCPGCERQIDVPFPSASPEPGPGSPKARPHEAPIARAPTPWERRGELGLVQAAWQTFKQVMFTPQTFWPSLRPDAPWVDAMLYGWLVTAVGTLLQVPFNVLTFLTMRRQMESVMATGGHMPPEFERMVGWMSEYGVSFSVGSALLGIVLYPLTFLIGGGLVHVGCLIFGAARNGSGATLRVMGYASAPSLLMWMPMAGGMAGLYILVLEVWGLHKVQETSVGRVIGAILVPVGVLMCCGCGTMVAVAAAIFGQR